MEFSGERVVPGRVEETLWAEHLARYSLSTRLVSRGARVLDYACGTGYGSTLLKEAGAERVVGVDRSVAAIEYARRHYLEAGIDFLVTDCTSAGLSSGWFDLVVCFEAIEHMDSPSRFLQEIERLLHPAGLLILSTPNKKTYTDERPVDPNPFHIKEFYRGEFVDLLQETFTSVVLYGQSTAEGVVFTNLSDAPSSADRDLRGFLGPEVTGTTPQRNQGEMSDFFVAFCRKSSAADRRTEFPPSDHYFFVSGTNEIRKNRNRVVELQNELEERTRWAKDLDRTVEHLRSRVGEDPQAVGESDTLIDRSRAELEASKSLMRSLDDRIHNLEADIYALETRWSERLEQLRADTGRKTEELRRLREQTEAESRLQRTDVVKARSRVAFIQSGSPTKATKCLKVLRERVYPDIPLTYVTHDPEVLPDVSSLPPQSEVLVADLKPTQILTLAVCLRHERFLGSVLMLTGEPGFRRFKFLGLLLASKNLLIFNENSDCFFVSPRWILRHFRWRIAKRTASSRVVSLLRATFRTLRNEGLRATLSRVRERWRVHWSYRVRRQRFVRLQRMKGHVFPEYEEPDLSVVIPAHNQERVTYDCLVSILKNAGQVRYEVIVADDASAPALGRMLARQKNVRTVRLEANRGFVGACNAGASAARGKIVFFLNNDTLLSPGTLQALLATFDDHPQCGVVGAKLVFPDGSLQEAGGIVWKDGRAWNYGRHDDPDKPEYNYLREVDYCSGAALAVRRAQFERLNGFDPHFAPGYFEDTDLCFRFRAAGYSVLYQPAAVVVHLEGISSRGRTDGGMKSYQRVNQSKFIERWRVELEKQVEHDPERVFLARDRHRGMVILTFDHYVPTPDKDAGSYVMFSVLEALCRAGHRVIFWPDNLYRAPDYAERLQQMGIEVIYGAVRYQQFLRKTAQFVDVAIAHRAKIASKYLPHIEGKTKRRAYICADLEHIREMRRFAVQGPESGGLEADQELLQRLERREAQLIRNVDLVAVHSPVEREILAREFPDTEIIVLPLPVKPGSTDGCRFEEREGLLFVGSSHPPNLDAVTFYHSELVDRIRAALNDVDLIVVGEVSKTLPKSVLKSPGIRFTGFVQSIEQYYESARVYVAPLRYGAGIKGKILEAMSFGLPVVTTPVGAEGIPIEDGVSALIAETPREFSDAVVRLYTNSELWDTIRKNAREIIETEYSSEVFRSRVSDLVGSPEILQRL